MEHTNVPTLFKSYSYVMGTRKNAGDGMTKYRNASARDRSQFSNKPTDDSIEQFNRDGKLNEHKITQTSVGVNLLQS